MKGLRLYKNERLCGTVAIDSLFAAQARRDKPAGAEGVRGAMAYPWRAVWRVSEKRVGLPARFLVSVPKKRARHAVDRVLLRRRCREAYRLSRHLFPAADCGVDIAFVFVGSGTPSYAVTAASVAKILTAVSRSLADESR